MAVTGVNSTWSERPLNTLNISHRHFHPNLKSPNLEKINENMGNVLDKYLCHKVPSDDLKGPLGNLENTSKGDTESTESFGDYMSSREISKHPKLVRRFHSFKRISV